MRHFCVLTAVLLLLGFFIHLNVVVGQPSAVAPPRSWKVSNMERRDNGSSIFPILGTLAVVSCPTQPILASIP